MSFMLTDRKSSHQAMMLLVTLFFIAKCSLSLATIDDSFNVSLQTLDDDVSAIATDSQQRILIGGSFAEVSGVARTNLARVSSESILDTSFNPNIDGPVKGIELFDNGKILIIGDFSTVSSTPRPGISLLNDDGSLDTNFAPDFGENELNDAVIQGANKIIASVGKQPYLDTSDGTGDGIFNPQNLIRLNLDGSVDTSFSDSATTGRLTALSVLNSGNLVVGEEVSNGREFSTGKFVLGAFQISTFDADGAAMTTLAMGGEVKKFLPTSSNQFVAAGCFDLADFKRSDCNRQGGCSSREGIARAKIALLNNDLTVDSSFNSRNDFGDITDACITDVDQNSDAEFIAIGDGDLQGKRRPKIRQRPYAKLTSIGDVIWDFDLALDPFLPQAVSFQSVDKILIGNRVNQLSDELAEGFVRVFEEPRTCFPIKNNSGIPITFCL